MYYWTIRGLWTGAGVCTILLGVASDGDVPTRLVPILGGLITTLLSILLGGFVVHLAGHGKHTAKLYSQLDARSERMFKILGTARQQDECDRIHKGQTDLLQAKMDLVQREIQHLSEALRLRSAKED